MGKDKYRRVCAFRAAVVALIIVVHIGLCMWGAFVHSPTVDEPAYLASGLCHWHLRRFDVCKVSPPLVRLVAAIPVTLASPVYNWSGCYTDPGSRCEHALGHHFLVANGARSFWLFTLGRWACIPFSLVGAYVSYAWAKELFGQMSAYAALLLWCFSPNTLGHAQLLTPDIGVTALTFAACYIFWKWSQSPTWWRVIAWGAALGLAVLAKTNAVIRYPAFASLFIMQFVRLRAPRYWAQLAGGLATSIYLLNLGYGFDGTLRPLGKYSFISTSFASADTNRFHGTALEQLPVPLPAAFLEGIDLQRLDFENHGGQRKTYFRGRWYDHGWWWYYLYALAVKEPLATLILAVAGAGRLCRMPGRKTHLFWALPGLLLLALPCTQTGFGHSVRYVLPALPYLYLLASAAFAEHCSSAGKFIAGGLLATSLWGSLSLFPHDLSYFSTLAGGPRNGHFHLLDGNLDWGQDLLFIRDWLACHPEFAPVYVAYWGFVPTRELGVEYREPHIAPGAPPSPGTYLISVNYLRGDFRDRRPELESFLQLQPVGRITPAVYRYQIE